MCGYKCTSKLKCRNTTTTTTTIEAFFLFLLLSSSSTFLSHLETQKNLNATFLYSTHVNTFLHPERDPLKAGGFAAMPWRRRRKKNLQLEKANTHRTKEKLHKCPFPEMTENIQRLLSQKTIDSLLKNISWISSSFENLIMSCEGI